jgi:choline kinase
MQIFTTKVNKFAHPLFSKVLKLVFVKKVRQGDRFYYYLVQSIRNGSKTTHRTIKRLTAEEANDPEFVDRFLKENPWLNSYLGALIVAAGKSTRLYPLTKDMPKCLIEIGGKTIIARNIDALLKNNVHDIIIVTGFGEDKFSEHIGNRVRCIYNPFSEVTGILASTWFGLKEIQNDFIFSYSDIIYDSDILKGIIEYPAKCVIGVKKQSISRDSEKVKIRGKGVTAISKDMPEFEADGEFIGIAKFAGSAVKAFRNTVEELARENTFPEYDFINAIERLLLKGHKIAPYLVDKNKKWIDVDSLDRLEEVKKYFSG